MSTLKILHLSDIHCSTSRLLEVLKLARDYNLVAVSGDIECIEAVEILAKASIPTVAITGNMDSRTVAEELEKRGILLDGRVVEKTGLKIAGIGGLDPRGDLEKLVESRAERIDILVTHQPPHGTVDRTFLGIRAGSREIKNYVLQTKPLVNLCGHIHESRGTTSLGETLVVNPGPLRKGYYAEILVELAGRKAQAVLRRL